ESPQSAPGRTRSRRKPGAALCREEFPREDGPRGGPYAPLEPEPPGLPGCPRIPRTVSKNNLRTLPRRTGASQTHPGDTGPGVGFPVVALGGGRSIGSSLGRPRACRAPYPYLRRLVQTRVSFLPAHRPAAVASPAASWQMTDVTQASIFWPRDGLTST